MHYGIIKPKDRFASLINFKDDREAMGAADLAPSKIDTGKINADVGIIVGFGSLFVPKEKQHYFSIMGKLYGGNAVLFGVGHGKTKSLGHLPGITWYTDWREVEQAIQDGKIEQPSLIVEGDTVWVWPQPYPMGIME